MEENDNHLTLRTEIKILLEYNEMYKKLDLDLNPIKLLLKLFNDDLEKMINDLEKIEKNNFYSNSKIDSILNTKIQVGVIGMTKSGKSTFLNSLIGKSILDIDTQKCTYFGTRIQASLNHSEMKFYELKNKENFVTDFQKIKEKISSINIDQRENNLQSNDVWVLETDIRAFSGKTRFNLFRDIYEHIELIDLPGIDDSKDNLDDKFSNILTKINLDAFIILIDYKNQEEVKKMLTYFHKHLFHGNEKHKFQEIICKRRFLIVVNKYEPEDPSSAEKNKKLFKDSILRNFFIPEETNILKKFFLRDSDAKKILRFHPSKLEEKEKEIESQVVFVSSDKAKFKEKENLRKHFENEGWSGSDLEASIKIEKEKIQNAIYDESSNFESLAKVLAKLFNEIGEKKVIEPLKEIKEYVLNVKRLVVEYKDSKCNLNQNFKKIQFETLLLFQILEKETKELIKNFENLATILVSLPPENVSETCEVIFQMVKIKRKIENKIIDVQTEVKQKLYDSNIYLICDSILKREIDLLQKEIDLDFIELLYKCFYPNNANIITQAELTAIFLSAETNEEAFCNVCKVIFPKISERPYNEKMKISLEIFEKFTQNIGRNIQVTKIKIETVLQFYKKINEIMD